MVRETVKVISQWTEPKLEAYWNWNEAPICCLPHIPFSPPRHFRASTDLYTAMAVPSSALKDLVKLPVAAEWKQLGVQLGVPIHTLDEIQANHEHSPNFAQECLSDMFTWWLNNGRDTTYERLECGLRDVGETRLAQQFHQQRSNSSGEQIRIIFKTMVCI